MIDDQSRRNQSGNGCHILIPAARSIYTLQDEQEHRSTLIMVNLTHNISIVHFVGCAPAAASKINTRGRRAGRMLSTSRRGGWCCRTLARQQLLMLLLAGLSGAQHKGRVGDTIGGIPVMGDGTPLPTRSVPGCRASRY